MKMLCLLLLLDPCKLLRELALHIAVTLVSTLPIRAKERRESRRTLARICGPNRKSTHGVADNTNAMHPARNDAHW
jgi:hypothetical protein